jgi:hypothetical protein
VPILLLLLLQTGPEPRLVFASYRLPDPAKAQADLEDLSKAGIDVALVPWPGDPVRLDALVSAARALDVRQVEVPRLAPLLSDASGFPTFLERVPPPFRLERGGRTVAWLGPGAGTAGAAKAACPGAWLVSERSLGAGADGTYAAGAGTRGVIEYGVVTVSPGKSRGDGAPYERAWTAALRAGCRWALVESWNGDTDGVEETPERGRKFLEITRRFSRHFHVGERVPVPKGPHTGGARVYYHAVHEPNVQGLSPMRLPDAAFERVVLLGGQMLTTREIPGMRRRALAFDVDDSFAWWESGAWRLEVEYLDAGEGRFEVEYDSGDRRLAPGERSRKKAGEVALAGTGEWKLAMFELADARFGNQLGEGADFRLCIEGRGLAVRRVVLGR